MRRLVRRVVECASAWSCVRAVRRVALPVARACVYGVGACTHAQYRYRIREQPSADITTSIRKTDSQL